MGVNLNSFRQIMDEVTKLQELRAAELNRLVLIQHDQVEMLKSLLKVSILISFGYGECKMLVNRMKIFRNKKALTKHRRN